MEEDIKILEEIIKGDEYCIQAIYNHNEKQKYNEEYEDIQHYKKEIKSVKNIINSYNKEKSRADKLEKDYSKSLTKIDKLEADLYSANSIISEQIDIINNSVSKDKIKEKIKELNKGIKEFKEYVADSIGEERQFYKKTVRTTC